MPSITCKNNISRQISTCSTGTGGIALIGILQEYRHVILIDATLDNNPPGTIRHLRPQYSQDYPPLLSAHEIGLKEMIDAMMIQDRIPEIDLIAISVECVKEVGIHLSPDVARSIPEIGEKVCQLINSYIKS